MIPRRFDVGVPRARAFQKAQSRFEIVPGDDPSSKKQPKRVEDDRDRSGLKLANVAPFRCPGSDGATMKLKKVMDANLAQRARAARFRTRWAPRPAKSPCSWTFRPVATRWLKRLRLYQPRQPRRFR